MSAHNHTDDRLTIGCPGCLARAAEARWTNAPEANVRWGAIVPTHIATHDSGGIEWEFTTTQRVPIDVTVDELEDLEGRSDIGAAMYTAMPDLDDDTAMTALECAEVHVIKVERPTPAIAMCDTIPLFGAP